MSVIEDIKSEYLFFDHASGDQYHVYINKKFHQLLERNDVCLIKGSDKKILLEGEPLLYFETTKTVYELEAPCDLSIVTRYELDVESLDTTTRLLTVSKEKL